MTVEFSIAFTVNERSRGLTDAWTRFDTIFSWSRVTARLPVWQNIAGINPCSRQANPAATILAPNPKALR
jgi:hypothetical protein